MNPTKSDNSKENNFMVVNEKNLKKFKTGIAGIGISFLFDRPLSEIGVKDIKNEFATGNSAEIKLRVHYGSIPEIKEKRKIFDSNTWSLYSSLGKYILRNDSMESGLLPETIIILEPDIKSGNIYIRNNTQNRDIFPDPLGYPLNQILMIILLSSLRKGILLHASSIDDGKRGHLFLGNSTHGKSTIAKLWSENGATVLNDDRIIVREKNGQFWMYGTPWHGDFREVSPKGMPIRKVFFLKHGKENSAVPKKGAEAVSMLLTRAFPPLWDQKGMDYTLSLLDRMASKLPCYELHFLPDKKIIDFARNI